MLRASARRVLRLVESEIARQGGGAATVYADQLEYCGSRRVYRPALAELHALGLIEVTRYPKRYVCRLSDGWRGVRTMRDALTRPPRPASTARSGTRATQSSTRVAQDERNRLLCEAADRYCAGRPCGSVSAASRDRSIRLRRRRRNARAYSAEVRRGKALARAKALAPTLRKLRTAGIISAKARKRPQRTGDRERRKAGAGLLAASSTSSGCAKAGRSLFAGAATTPPAWSARLICPKQADKR